jgi:hypothetical protein
MRRESVSIYLLPPGPGRKSPYPARFRMTAAEAEKRGAVGMVPGTTEIREVPETEAEMQASQFNARSAGMGGVRGPSG